MRSPLCSVLSAQYSVLNNEYWAWPVKSYLCQFYVLSRMGSRWKMGSSLDPQHSSRGDARLFVSRRFPEGSRFPAHRRFMFFCLCLRFSKRDALPKKTQKCLGVVGENHGPIKDHYWPTLDKDRFRNYIRGNAQTNPSLISLHGGLLCNIMLYIYSVCLFIYIYTHVHIGYTHLYIWDIRCSGFMSIHWAWMCRKSNSWIYGNIQYVANQLARIYVFNSPPPESPNPQFPHSPVAQIPRPPKTQKFNNFPTPHSLTSQLPKSKTIKMPSSQNQPTPQVPELPNSQNSQIPNS